MMHCLPPCLGLRTARIPSTGSGVACTAFPDEELRTAAVILRERIKEMDDFSWTALYKMAKWEISSIFDCERFLYDAEDEVDENFDLDDEDDTYES